MKTNISDKEFKRYFLKAQREGYEVYLGEGIVLVIYEKDKRMRIQCNIGYFLWDFGAVFYEIADLVGSGLEKELLEIRKPENLTRIREDLTKKIREIYESLVPCVEDLDSYYLILYEEEKLRYIPPNSSQLEFDF